MEFEEHHIDEDVETFHHRDFGGTGRQLWWPRLPTTPLLVLGSTQPVTTVDSERLDVRNIDLVRRRSGGGAVLVGVDELFWFDLVIDRDDDLWDDDVGRAFAWVGEVLLSALLSLGVDGAIHSGSLITSEWSDRVCFAGLGPGEITNSDGAKIAGVSQRRTRDSARFQCAVLRRWDSEGMVDLLALEPDDRDRAVADLRETAAGIDVSATEFRQSISTALPH